MEEWEWASDFGDLHHLFSFLLAAIKKEAYRSTNRSSDHYGAYSVLAQRVAIAELFDLMTCEFWGIDICNNERSVDFGSTCSL